MKNKNLLLAGGLVALAVILYMRANKKPEMSNACGMCGANGESWGFEETKDWN
jgi:hypothetical protein